MFPNDFSVLLAKRDIYFTINLVPRAMLIFKAPYRMSTPKLVEICSLGKVKHNNLWLVKLATRTKIKVSEVVMDCPIEINGLLTK